MAENNTSDIKNYRLEIDELVKSLTKLKKVGEAEIKVKASAQSLTNLSNQIQKAISSKSFNVKSNIKIDTSKFDTSKIDLSKIKPLFGFINKINGIDTSEFLTKSLEISKGTSFLARGITNISELNTALFSLKYKEFAKTLSKPLFKDDSFKNVNGFTQYVSSLNKLSSISTSKFNSVSKGLKNINKSASGMDSLDVDFINNFDRLASSYKKLDKTSYQKNASAYTKSYARNVRGTSVPILKSIDAITDFKTSGVKSFIANMKAINQLSFNPELIKDLGVIGSTAEALSKTKSFGNLQQVSTYKGVSKDNSISETISTVLATLLSAGFIAKLSAISKEMIDYQGFMSSSGFDVLSSRVGIESLGGNATRVGQEILQKRRALFDAQIFGKIDNKQMALMGMLGTNYTSSFNEIRTKAFNIKDSQLRDYLVNSLYGDEMSSLIRRQASAYVGANNETKKYLNSMFSFNANANINTGEFSRFFINIQIFFARIKHLVQAVSGDSISNFNIGLQRLNISLQGLLGDKGTIKGLSSMLSSFFSGFMLPFKLFINAISTVMDTLSVFMGNGVTGNIVGGFLKLTGVLISLKTFFIALGGFKKLLGFGFIKALPTGMDRMLGKTIGALFGKWFLPSLFITDVAEGLWGAVKGQLQGWDLGQFIIKTIIQMIGAALSVLVSPMLGIPTMLLADSISKEAISIFKKIAENSDEQNKLSKEQLEYMKSIKAKNPSGNNDTIYLGAN